MRILFICTGNTCRSPMAEKIFKKLAAERGVKAEAKSAGLFAVQGSAASPNAVKVLEKKGIEEEHTSQTVNEDLLRWADLIVTMTESHKHTLIQRYPEFQGKVHTLKEYTDTSESARKRLQELNRLYEQLEVKQTQFMKEHYEEINKLEEEYQQLYHKLELVREKLDNWKEKMMQATAEERNQIAILESQKPDYDIVDPFGGTLETYEKCAQEIEESLIRLLDMIEKIRNFHRK
ncbi:low molecular weight protein arginine phosphatase [Aneurinibacillus thermoaerophilus]|uniref:low molecular weight protein arginine phosphatase n=1 Tax=Aneurinibacillus thermoaerophilus TaxID=143495 RepID=UPI002E2222A8|nr:low molecular weight protein arginine phosphatase [Aneurinibacillus thermoaerophilus]MED0763848.1 low molecular weight protein arginine phosphatase [Aneurinibacillus thermoaerophilus]